MLLGRNINVFFFKTFLKRSQWIKVQINSMCYGESRRKIVLTNSSNHCNRCIFANFSFIDRNCRNFYFVNSNFVFKDDKELVPTDKTGKQYLSVIEKHFQITTNEATEFLKANNCLKDNVDELQSKLDYCESLGLSKEIIKENGWVLSFSKDELFRKIKLLQQWNFTNISCSIKFLKFPFKKLRYCTKFVLKERSVVPELKDSNRFTFLSKLLQKDELVIGELVYKHKFLLTINFKKMKDILEMILSYDMATEHLINDIFVVKFNLNEIKERLEILDSSLNRKEFRPWMLRCQRPVFKRTLEIRDENRTALEPFTNSTEYLCNRLNVDESGIQCLIKKHPPLHRVQVHKLKEILDFLFSKGFTPAHVCSSPRVLCHSLTTLEKRLKILHNIGYRPRHLHVLCKTQKKFSEFLGKQSSDKYGIKQINN